MENQKYKDYYITPCGRVWSYKRNKFLIPGLDKRGYPMVNIMINGKQHIKRIHRLVAETYLENFNNLPQVNHKDENKLNNNVNNLEWCTNWYNYHYGTGRQRYRETMILRGYWNGR